ncbi:MAG: DUF1549 and DUF1553 domain-containing protein [Bryobacteraceae bacterium]
MRRAQHAAAAAAALLVTCVATFAWTDAKDEAFIGRRRNWWSFQKPVRADIPKNPNAWVKTPVDAFLMDAMQAKGLFPSAPLEKEKLLRRVTLDLTGLPPTPEEADAFLRDRSPKAYEKLVDRLLGSVAYGERWALRWLDVVRYADTNGYEIDAERPHAWRYRDYVARSFNANKPYDRFLKEQIAGDELYPGDKDAFIATGFHRAGPIHLVAGNQDEEANRQEVLTEMAGAIGSTFLGMTVGCARCHNHKFDPILQADYYRLQAVFAATEGKDIPIASSEETASYDAAKKDYDARIKPIHDEIKAIERPYLIRLEDEKRAKLEAKYVEVLKVPEKERTAEQKALAHEAHERIEPTWDEVLNLVPPVEKARRTALRKRLHEIELTEPLPPPTAYAVANMDKAPPIHILKVGDVHMKLGVVEPGLLTVLTPPDAPFPNSVSGRRTALANWLASADHPLTARVMVNRIWQLRMGTGLVATPNDFGVLGSRPTNKTLLDWLATEFVAQGWSVKAIDRMIVTSSVYKQSADIDAAKAKIDPDNKLYWRMNRRRLEGEAIRDGVLAVAGNINLKVGGPPVRVPIEPEVYDLIFSEHEPDNLWPLLRDPHEYDRRSLYLLNKRTVRLPMLANFDQPDAMTSCPMRPTSTHALQALSMMNSDFMNDEAKRFSKRLESDCGKDASCQVQRAYKLTLARKPSAAEVSMAVDFFAHDGPLEDFCLAMLNRNEFVYVP